jgi:hypothetical protein
MALTKRLVKGSPLTFAEGDANLDYLEAVATNTGSFATTGSNTFIGNQTINGSSTFSGSNTFIGNQTVSGSILGNITPLSIISNTASLDLSVGSFYTLQLVQGTNTHINPSNIKAGETVSLLLSTTGSATVSFPTSVKQPSGSSYIPTTTTAKDILTLISFDASNLYLVNVKNLI